MHAGIYIFFTCVYVALYLYLFYNYNCISGIGRCFSMGVP